jgi:hypothetical protein
MKNKETSLLPSCYNLGHDLCFLNHDILVQLLVSGEEQCVFKENIVFKDAVDREEFENAEHIFEWLDSTERVEEKAKVLRTIVFPALLSDFLMFIFESLKSSKAGKLTVSYSLLRKPIQEILYVFEVMLIDCAQFSQKLSLNPSSLHSQSAGGLDVHQKRIEQVLKVLSAESLFDAKYIAQLRYSKDALDGFDGVCNKAVHLFTTHKAIKTEPLNINFIFSDWDAKITQWNYLYSRLPYILTYARLVIEYISSQIIKTDPMYLDDMERRVSASILLWSESIENDYMNPELAQLIEKTRQRLFDSCKVSGYCTPNTKHLKRMVLCGAFPHESKLSQLSRELSYKLNVAINKAK